MIVLAFFNTANLARLIEGGLATAGGFLVGYVLVAVVGWLIDRHVFKRTSPLLAHRAFRLAGGLLVAILVAMMVFGGGGGGEGAGTGEGSGNGKSSPTTGTGDPKASPAPGEVKPAPPPTGPPAEERVRVTVLGGTDVKDQKFYQVEDDATPRTFAEVKAAVQKKKDGTTKSLGLEIRLPPQNTLPQDHPAVGQLARWARETAGLTVTFAAETP